MKLFGLSASEFLQLITILSNYQNTLKKVILFGSRARSDYKTHSDIDLAIEFKNSLKYPNLSEAFEMSNLAYTVDLLDLTSSKDKNIFQHIASDGIILFDENGKQEKWMTLALINEKLQDFNNALSRLEEALQKDIYQDDMYLDATIQRFEFCYELCWKLIKSYLNYIGITANSPRAAFREAFKQELIIEIDLWIKMLDKRNLTSHTYHEDMAKDVYYAIKDDFYDLLEGFNQKIIQLIEALINDEKNESKKI